MEYVEQGDCVSALASMLSDLGKHPETEKSVEIGGMLMFTINTGDPQAVRRFITGFN